MTLTIFVENLPQNKYAMFYGFKIKIISLFDEKAIERSFFGILDPLFVFNEIRMSPPIHFNWEGLTLEIATLDVYINKHRQRSYNF